MKIKLILGASIKFILMMFGLITLFSGGVQASNIGPEQTGSTGGLQINVFEPIGQSFTAVDSNIFFGFNFKPFNLTHPVDDITFSLLEGDGFGGPQLYSETYDIIEGYDGFFDIDLTALSRVVGDLYTAVVATTSDSPYWGLRTFGVYTGGTMYIGQQEFASTGTAWFRAYTDCLGLHIRYSRQMYYTPPPSSIPPRPSPRSHLAIRHSPDRIGRFW